MIDPDPLIDALVGDADDVQEAAARAVGALAAWRAFPPFIRRAYPREARRLAKRAAAALVELVQLGRVDGHEDRPGPRHGAAGGMGSQESQNESHRRHHD